MMPNRWTVFCPLTVMFTMYAPLAMSPGRSRMVVKRSPLLPNSLAKTCLPKMFWMSRMIRSGSSTVCAMPKAHAATSPSWIAFATAAVLLFTCIFW